MQSQTLVYFGIPNKDIPWGGWHVTVCGRTDLSEEAMTDAVRRAVVAADLGDNTAIADWYNERDCVVSGDFIWINNATIKRFERRLSEILWTSHGIRMKEHFNSDGYFHILLAGRPPTTVAAQGPLRLFVVSLTRDASNGDTTAWRPVAPDVPVCLASPGGQSWDRWPSVETCPDDDCRAWFRVCKNPSPGRSDEHVFHYTNRTGIEGILTSQSLRASIQTGSVRMGVGVYFTRKDPGNGAPALLFNNYTVPRGPEFTEFFIAVPAKALRSEQLRCEVSENGRDVCVLSTDGRVTEFPLSGTLARWGRTVEWPATHPVTDLAPLFGSKPPPVSAPHVPPAADPVEVALLSWNILFKTQMVDPSDRPDPCRGNDPSGTGVCVARILHRLAHWCRSHANGPFFLGLQEFLDPGDRIAATLCGNTRASYFIGCVTAIVGPRGLKVPILYNARFHVPLLPTDGSVVAKGPHWHTVIDPPTAGWVLGKAGRPFFACMFRDRANAIGLVVNVHAGHRRRTHDVLNAVAADLRHRAGIPAKPSWAVVMGDFNAEVEDERPRSFGTFGPSTNGQHAGPLANCCWSDGAYRPKRTPSRRYTQVWTFGTLRARRMQVLDWGGADAGTFHSDHRPTEVLAEQRVVR